MVFSYITRFSQFCYLPVFQADNKNRLRHLAQAIYCKVLIFKVFCVTGFKTIIPRPGGKHFPKFSAFRRSGVVLYGTMLFPEHLHELMERLSPRLPLMSSREGREMDLRTGSSHRLDSSLRMSDTRICLAA